MDTAKKGRVRAHYESRCRLAFPDAFTTNSIIHAYDVGYALIEKHFDRPPIGHDEIFVMAEKLLADLRPDEEVEKALEEIPCMINVLGALIATGLLRKGLRPTWTETEKGELQLFVQKVEWDQESGPRAEADPMEALRKAYLEGPVGKLTAWRDQIFEAMAGFCIQEAPPPPEEQKDSD